MKIKTRDMFKIQKGKKMKRSSPLSVANKYKFWQHNHPQYLASIDTLQRSSLHI